MENSTNYFDQKQTTLITTLSVSQPEAAKIVSSVIAKNGGKVWDENNAKEIDILYARASKTMTFNDMSFNEVQAMIEHIRIANPNEGMSIHNLDRSSFIGNVTWADQMEMFWEYPTYTPEGARLASLRKAEQDAKGVMSSCE